MGQDLDLAHAMARLDNIRGQRGLFAVICGHDESQRQSLSKGANAYD
jgi:hypothetical protein